jgi:dipeptidyl aminopeptidase/acylaminoacyl peptidase
VRTYEDQDSIDIVDYQGKLWPQKLVYGDDFYLYPTWHPDGEHIAWVAWSHPNMPWDSSYLRIGILSQNPGQAGLPTLADVTTVAGDKNSSVLQPTFSPDGRYLAYISDESGWWHIYLYELNSGDLQQVTTGEVEHGMPAWLQGLRTYSFTPDGSTIYFIRNEFGFASLWRYEIASGKQVKLDFGSEYTWLEQPSVAPDGERVAMVASSSKVPKRVVVYNIGASNLEVRRRSGAEDIPAEFYSQPQSIVWEGMDGGEVFGLYYPPQNPAFTSDGLPPLVMLIHGGPTSQRNAAYDAQVPFFTSRGYAVLQVNYRGSTGYGRSYRNMLRGNWGIYDVQDSVSGARYLVEQGWVDGNRLVIMGGSSGGFTVLKALEDYPGFFKAGINLYGVSNQFTMASDTHKFESHYSDMLIGALPDAVDLYYERSPIFFVDKIQDPIAIFQGENDQVVIRSQSDEVVESLRRRGVPHIYQVYAGEGHGFRKSETIQHFYESVDKFLRQFVIYA